MSILRRYLYKKYTLALNVNNIMLTEKEAHLYFPDQNIFHVGIKLIKKMKDG